MSLLYTKMTANIHTHSAQHALSSAKPIGLFYESVLRPEAAGTLSNVTELGTIYRAKEGRSINSSRILYDRMECLPSCPSLSIFSISTTFADWEGCCVGIWRNVTLSLYNMWHNVCVSVREDRVCYSWVVCI